MFHDQYTSESCEANGYGLGRIYALSMKENMVAAFFCGVAIPQFLLGIYLTVLGAINPRGSSFCPALRGAENKPFHPLSIRDR